MGLTDFIKKIFDEEPEGVSKQKKEEKPVKKTSAEVHPKPVVFDEAHLIAILEKSRRQFVKIKALEAQNLPLTASKFLGKPYLPENGIYPMDKKNQPMLMLAQINFSEMPLLENYPKEGILQFYICAHDGMMGLNSKDNTDPSSFRVLYHPVVIEDKTTPNIPTVNVAETGTYSPIMAEYKLTFSLDTEYVPSTDTHYFKQFFGKDYYDFIQANGDEKLWDKYTSKLADSSGHKIGGYAFFTQEDPRYDAKYADFDTLLLQIDSEGEHIQWGDMGVGNLFIKEKDLKNKDFSHVMYSWDCH